MEQTKWYMVKQWDATTRGYRVVAKFLFESDARDYVNQKVDQAERHGGGNIDLHFDHSY